jgi:uncharacterized protein (TIGR02594 family)
VTCLYKIRSGRSCDRALIGRRTLLRSGVCWSALFLLKDISGFARGPRDDGLSKGIGIEPDFDGPLPQQKLGTKHPLPPEEAIARAIIDRAPAGTSPFDVARYFLDVGNGKFGDQWRPYISGWPDRWNPVIVNFFQATDTTPTGDLTAWCAAFANWCFLQSFKTPATKNASSGSFRCFGSKTNSPKTGDIAVFKQVGSEDPCSGHGHVGFFVKDYGSEIEILGGNQIEGHERSHRISSKRLKKEGNVLVFHSYSTYPRTRGYRGR